ncbi:outer membrane protein transport protein [Zobellella maritima]|uniref:outer membrane protein transport protein n=1 Tax=Zobellella maritima TaxID=2059725 RepID=UPI000E307D3B|nr:outer membrane protein transport protein [Zobellella maritima]
MCPKNLKLSLLAAAVATGQAHSAAFQLAEQNTTGLGRAYAGEGAIGDNASVLGRNPAAMTLFDSVALSAGAVYVNPEVDVAGKGATATTGQSAGLPTHSEDIADDALVPFFYYIQPINDQWAAGFGAFTNYGLSTSYQDNHYAGTVAGRTSLTTLNLNPNIAFKANNHLSLGAGVNAVYADAELVRHSGIAGSAFSLQPSDEFVRLEGDDWGYGWNIGLLFEADDNHRWGLSYRSEVELTLKGNYSSALPAVPLPPGVPAGTSDQRIPGTLDLTLPAIAEFSGFHRLTPDWALHYGLLWTEWSSFQELKAEGAAGQELFQKDEQFKNSWRISAGATHLLDEQWTLRGGVAYDRSPVREAFRSISIPDSNRIWYSLGSTYAYNQQLSFDASFAFLDGKKVEVREDNFEFISGGDAYLFGLQANYRF